MALLLPWSAVAVDTVSAMLHTKGGVLVNGNEVPDATAVFSGDVLQTQPGAVANLDVDGSSVLIQAESIVKFNGDSLTLEHGSVSVGTSKSMSVHVNCINVVPVSNEWTQYDVTDTNGTVVVVAHKNDVNITEGVSFRKRTPTVEAAASVTVHEGEQASRDESQACGTGEAPHGAGNGINTKWIEIGAGAGGGGLILCLLLCSGPGQKKISPDSPKP